MASSWYDSSSWGDRARAGRTSVAPAAVATPQQPAAPHIGLSPGWVQDYKALIYSSPEYMSWLNNSTMDVNQAAAARRAALQQLVIRYGGTGKLQDAYGDIDEPTRELAQRNEFSDLARLRRNYEQGVDAFKKHLAGRGGLQSGELQYGLDQADYARGAGEYDLGQEFMNAAQMALNNYLGVESQARHGQVGAIGAAQAGVFANPAYQPVPEQRATYDAGLSTTYGRPVYVGPDGRRYFEDGTPAGDPPVTPSVPAAAEPYFPWFSPGLRSPAIST